MSARFSHPVISAGSALGECPRAGPTTTQCALPLRLSNHEMLQPKALRLAQDLAPAANTLSMLPLSSLYPGSTADFTIPIACGPGSALPALAPSLSPSGPILPLLCLHTYTTTDREGGDEGHCGGHTRGTP